MADPKKVRWSQLKVGVVGLAAFLILAVLIFLVTSSKGFFQKTAFLHTFMDDAGGMAEGTPVRLNGFSVGSLESSPSRNRRCKPEPWMRSAPCAASGSRMMPKVCDWIMASVRRASVSSVRTWRPAPMPGKRWGGTKYSGSAGEAGSAAQRATASAVGHLLKRINYHYRALFIRSRARQRAVSIWPRRAAAQTACAAAGSRSKPARDLG